MNSKIRARYAESFRPDLQLRPNRFIWLGTDQAFEAFTFDFRRTQHGWFQAHIYRFDANTSTFIVETTGDAFKAHGLDRADQDKSIAFCEQLFADTLGGHKLMTNARHLRGAIELTRQFDIAGHDAQRIPEVLAAYETDRRVGVARIQNAARNAMEWFEVVGERYADRLEPEQFMYSMLTRSQRISHENLRVRDKAWLEGFERWFAAQSGVELAADAMVPPPMFTPFRVRGLTLQNRIVVSPMAMYSATDGVPNDFHLVHLGARAMGGAALVFPEMTCVSADARITPGCLGLWNETQADAFRRIVDFVQQQTPAKIGMKRHVLPKIAQGALISAFALTEPEAGSDVAAMSSAAHRDNGHYVINGEKIFISNGGIADVYTVFARTGEAPGTCGISAFVVFADTPGFSVAERIETLAPHPLARIRFDDCRIPAGHLLGTPGEGFKIAMRTLDIFRPSVAAAANGFARRALDEAVAHARGRKMFGTTLADLPITQSRLGEMATAIDAAALLTLRTAWRRDVQKLPTTREAAMAKMTATENAQWVIDQALQLFGGRGVRTGEITERLYREIRALRIYEGATEVQKLIVGRELLKI